MATQSQVLHPCSGAICVFFILAATWGTPCHEKFPPSRLCSILFFPPRAVTVRSAHAQGHSHLPAGVGGEQAGRDSHCLARPYPAPLFFPSSQPPPGRSPASAAYLRWPGPPFYFLNHSHNAPGQRRAKAVCPVYRSAADARAHAQDRETEVGKRRKGVLIPPPSCLFRACASRGFKTTAAGPKGAKINSINPENVENSMDRESAQKRCNCHFIVQLELNEFPEIVDLGTMQDAQEYQCGAQMTRWG